LVAKFFKDQQLPALLQSIW